MVNNNSVVEITCLKKNLPEVEKFIDTLSEQVFINDSYYGSILTVITELFSLLCEEMPEAAIKYDYHTDFKNITIRLQTVDKQIVKDHLQVKKLNDLTSSVTSKRAFLINTLCDHIEESQENGISLGFDISAVHQLISDERTSQLRHYFDGSKKKALTNNHD